MRSSPRSVLYVCLAASLAAVGCSNKPDNTMDGGGGSGGSGGSGGNGGGTPTPVDPPALPDMKPAEVAMNPTTPKTEDGQAFGGTTAPLMEGVQVVVNRDSALLIVPVVTGVVDYRAFRLPAGAAAVTVGAAEKVNGTVIHCAGYRQHNDKYTGTRELMRVIEVTGLSEAADVVIEAIDTACPFPGVLAGTHVDMHTSNDGLFPNEMVPFSFYTADDIKTKYGSLIRNGHGPGPTLASQGDAAPPKVLARTTVHLTPTGRATPRTRDFFDDFDGTSGPLTSAGAADDARRCHAKGRRFTNDKWDFFTFDDEGDHADISFDRGVMHVALPDWHQDVFATVVAVPRRPAQLSDTAYLHLTFEVASDATSRRYWWVGLCGAGQAGQTFDSQNHFAGRLVQTSFFYQPDGKNTSVEGWNCLQFFPRDGSPFGLNGMKRTESDIRVMVNRADAGERDSVVNVSPPQYKSGAQPGWFLQQNATVDKLGKPVIDDQMLIAPRARFDVYVRRDRFVMYVNGEQRICNDFPTHKLTMAEAAVAFGQVLYHTAAERDDFIASFNVRDGQRYYLENMPYADERDWDNVGYEENIGPPSNLDATKCYVAP
ncbi:MAG: hypothetical protein IPJ65_04940 [Archangiaceae bacterium]|nr:hypothetical protein [Archangiaceae bacterium]